MGNDRSNKYVGSMDDFVVVDDDEKKAPSLVEQLRKLHSDHRYDQLPKSEQRAMDNTLKEAEEAEAEIRRGGFGGLIPSLALGIYRRDKFRCKRCGGADDLGLHHKGGEKASRHAWRKKKNTTNNLVVLCQDCHNSVHTQDNAATEGT